MKTLYSWNTPNGRKISIALEEMGLAYDCKAVDITKGEQMAPDFLAMNPNNKIPVLADADGTIVNETNAILLYLGRQTGQFMPPEDSSAYWKMMEWLMWQASGFGPMLGQAHHFLHYNSGKSEYAEARYHKEAVRLYNVLDRYLTGRDFMLDEISILEFAIWPWVSRYEYQRIDLADFPAVRDWYVRCAARPAFVRGYAQPNDVGPIPMPG
ncbi:MAG: glutathione S-transferase family protein [Sedimentitalea sp.]